MRLFSKRIWVAIALILGTSQNAALADSSCEAALQRSDISHLKGALSYFTELHPAPKLPAGYLRFFNGAETPFRSEFFYQYFSDKPLAVKRLLMRWYGWGKGEALFQAGARVLNEAQMGVLLDPGIASRARAFLEFASRSPETQLASSFELRNAFSSELGTVTVYRGMSLSSEELATIAEQGILSPHRYYYSARGSAFEDQVSAFLSRGPGLEIRRKFGLSPRHPDALSVSKIPEVALSVGKQFQSEGRELYLITLEVPEIELIDRTDFDIPWVGVQSWKWIEVGENRYRTSDLRIEQFIFHYIPSDWIVDVSRSSNPVPHYRFK